MKQSKTAFVREEIKINQSKAKHLFLVRPIWQSLLIVATPGMVVVFMQGLFIFVSQLMMIDLIPLDGLHTNEYIWGPEYHDMIQAIHSYNVAHPDNPLPIYNIRDLIKSASSFATPLTLIISASVILASQGSAVLYSRAIGNKKYHKATNLYYEAIIISLVFSTLAAVVMLAVARVWIHAQANAPHNYDHINSPLIQQYYLTFTTTTINWSAHYFYVYTVSAFFQAYTLICTYFIVSEGRNNLPTIITLISQSLGILIAFLLIYFARLQMYGAAIAAIFVYVINCLLFMGYIYYLEKKSLTCLTILFHQKVLWVWKEVKMIVALGMGNFAKNMSGAFLASFTLEVINEVNININGPSHALFYSSVYGIVLPIYTLMFSTRIGIVRAARSVSSYVYGVHEYKKVRQVYWWTNLYTTIYCTLLFFIVVFLLGGYKMPGDWGRYGPFISIFHLNYYDNPHQYLQVQYLLMINMLQLPFSGFNNAGSLFFQSTRRPILNLICALMRGVIVLIPVLFILRAISLSTHDINWILWTPAVVGILSSVIIGIMSLTYMYTKFKKEEIVETKKRNEALALDAIQALTVSKLRNIYHPLKNKSLNP